MRVDPRNGLRRGGYLLPSLFTIGNILLGFFALVRGYRGDYETAALLIMAAAILDGLDGRIARLTGTDSEFGKEFDSLADVLTFGATPAILAFLASLHAMGRVGWLVPPFYLICCATRLARFNVQVKIVDSRSFVGLPAPAAASAVAAVLLFTQNRQLDEWLAPLLVLALMVEAILMVSTFRYPSFKVIDFRKRRSYRMALPIAAALLVVGYDPPLVLLLIAIVYTLWGPGSWLWGRLRHGGRAAADAGEAPGVDPRRG